MIKRLLRKLLDNMIAAGEARAAEYLKRHKTWTLL